MAESSRLANLPGYDTAPDVYETSELTESTQPASPRSAVDTEPTSNEDDDDDELDDDDDGFGVSRRRLFPSRARRRFEGTSGRVETAGIDLSDRIDGRRRGYRVRRQEPDEEEDEAEESLEARIARLRRELEECKVQAEEEGAEGGAEVVEEHDVEGLSELLAGIDASSSGRSVARSIARAPAEHGVPAQDEEEMSEEQMLGRVADFDTRLAALEHALGLSSLDGTDVMSGPVLPSLSLLDQQLTALTSATSLTSLEAASTRIQKLKAETAQLALSQPESDGEVAGDSTQLSPEDEQKLQHLHTLLPTLQSLAPTVPAILSRLRSLRTLHTGAASAASELEEVEKRQAEMEQELKAWREGLEKVEQAVSQASEANGKNGMFVERWVKELEGRVRGLQ